MHGRDKLDGSSEGELGRRREGGTDGLDEAIGVNANVHENIEDREARGRDGDEAGVAIVDEEVGGECGGREVIEAAGAVGGVAEDEDFVEASVGGRLEDVGDGKGVHEEAIGELERGATRAGRSDAVDGLMDLEVIVGRKEGGGGVDGGIGKDRLGDVRFHKALWSRSGDPLRRGGGIIGAICSKARVLVREGGKNERSCVGGGRRHLVGFHGGAALDGGQGSMMAYKSCHRTGWRKVIFNIPLIT